MGFTATITTNIAPAGDLVTRPLPLDYVCTRLTQPDPLMHFFSIIRLRGGLNWCRDSFFLIQLFTFYFKNIREPELSR